MSTQQTNTKAMTKFHSRRRSVGAQSKHTKSHFLFYLAYVTARKKSICVEAREGNLLNSHFIIILCSLNTCERFVNESFRMRDHQLKWHSWAETLKTELVK